MSKSLMVNIGVGIVCLVLGGAIVYGVAVAPRSGDQAGASRASSAVRIDNVGVGSLPPLGSPDAPVKIVEFADFQCPYCKAWHENTAPALIEKYGDQIAVYFRHYPLTYIHPQAMDGAIAAECANEQGKFWEMHDELYKTQDVIGVSNSRKLAETLGLDTAAFNSCMATNPVQGNVNDDVLDGVSYGVSGTPTFFINGVRLVGALPVERFVAVIDQELSK